LLATNLSLLPRRLQLPVALRVDLLLRPASMSMSFGVMEPTALFSRTLL
jgi:hypothetical protein